MRIRQLVFALAAICVTATTSAQTAIYMGRAINLVVPAGQCLLGSTPLEVEILANATKAMEGYNHVLGAFGECREVAQLRRGQALPLSSFGQILASTPKGRQVTANGMSRTAYISYVAGSPAKVEDTVRRMKELMRSRNEYAASTQSLGVRS